MQQPAEAGLNGSLRLGNYLRRLRTGYGYSLRRVEEKARAEGGEIDNSQLSRYEKGICYPSFDKLRVLAAVFNVPVQAFSDVVDLDVYEAFRPESTDVTTLLDCGRSALRAGRLGEAFAAFEKAVDVLEDLDTTSGADAALLARARINLGHALARLGKLALAERELRRALRTPEALGSETTARGLLAVANLHAEQGDLLLAEIEAERALVTARNAELPALAAMSVHALARVLAQRARYAEAIDRYREAAVLYEQTADTIEAVRVRVNIGDSYVAMGKVREGIRLLRAALAEARTAGYRRIEAQAWSNLGAAHCRAGEFAQAQSCFRESDALAGSGPDKHPDLLFFNAFHEWKMAGQLANPTREKIAFGRLKVLRSSLERRFPEVEAFDAIVEKGRHHA